MAAKATQNEFVAMVAEEVSTGIDRALGHWLGRIELEVVDHSLTTAQRLEAIESIVREFKILSGREVMGCASA
jgi:hypothetical protein